MSINYASDVRGTGPSNVASTYGVTEESWHMQAIKDTGTSHTLPGLLYVVQCEWCTEAFAAHTKAVAMDMFRLHEDAMIRPHKKQGAPE